MQKFPDVKEDEFGNLVRKVGSGGKKIMVYASLDEDSAVLMELSEDKAYFKHLGTRKIYPGQSVSFGGYTGIVCADSEKAEENQYIKLIDCEDGIEIGRCGVFEAEFEGDTENENATLLGKNIAMRSAISAMLCDFDVKENEFYFVFGVQSNHQNKGLLSAISTIKPDEVLVFEETDNKKFALKLMTKGFSLSEEKQSKAQSLFEKCEIEYEQTACGKEKSQGEILPFGKSTVIGIPVTFKDFIRQGIKTKTVKDIKKLIKCYVED